MALDKVENYSVVASPRFGASVPLNRSGTRAKATWAKGFNMPSFYALGNPLVGNRSLEPERSRSYDAGIEQEFARARVHLSGTYFHNRFSNLIDFSPELFRLVNRRNAITQGAEFDLERQWNSRLSAGLSAAYTVWKLVNTTEALRDQPHWRAGVHRDAQPLRNLSVSASTLWVTRRYDYQVPVPDRTTVGGYSTTSLAGQYRLSDFVRAFIRVDNLFNDRYHEFVGFPAAGTYIRFGLNFLTNLY